MLKPDAPYPPQPGKMAHWQKVTGTRSLPAVAGVPSASKKNGTRIVPAKMPYDCLPLPPNTMTRALRLTFIDRERETDLVLGDIKVEDGKDPSLDDVDLSLDGKEKRKALSIFNNGDRWQAKLAGMRLLRRRFENVASVATVRVNSGKYDSKTGEWDAQRTEIIKPDAPAIFVLQWAKPQKLRGLAIKEIAGARAEIDVFVGGSEIDINSTEGWQRVGTYTQKQRSGAHNSSRNNARAAYLDDCVDFGAEYTTRAVRLRIVQPQMEGVFKDKTGNRARHCKVYGIAALSYLGGEPPIDDRLITQRLETHDAKTGKLLREVPSPISGDIAMNPAGELFGVSGKQIVRIDPQTGKISDPVAPDIHIPGVMEFDGKGNLYVFDYDRKRANIQVYKPNVSNPGNGTPAAAGKLNVPTTFSFSHTVGAAGIAGPGLRDPAQLDDATSFTIDKENNLWAVYPHVWPRRVSHFKTDGTFVKEMLGNTLYGGGGTMDRYDKSRVYYMDMEFEVDVDKGKSRIKAFNTRDHNYSNPWFQYRFRNDLTAVMIDGRRYLVTQPQLTNPFTQAGWVHLVDEKTRAMKLVAGVGLPTASDFFRTPEFMDHLDGKQLNQFRFIWADRNGDERPQPDEVQFTPNTNNSFSVGRFSLDLSLATSDGYYRVKEFTDAGAPIFEEVKLPSGGGHVRLSDGSFFRMGADQSVHGGGFNRVVTPEGKTLWNYPAWNGVSGLWIPPWVPGQVGTQLHISGHEVAPEGDLGEFLVISCNTGQMNIWTSDGLLAGLVTYSARDPRRRGFPGTCKPGTRMDFYTQGQEHFHSFFTRTEDDDRYFIITGGNHVSIVEVRGLEKFKRISGEFVVTPEMIRATREWDAKRERHQNFVRAQLAPCYQMTRRPRIDGQINEGEWPEVETSINREIQAKLQCGWDDNFLYLAYRVTGAGPWTNSGDDFRRYFKTGGAVDIMIGADANAHPKRKQPVAGDMRLLLTRAEGKPSAVLYRAISPDAPADRGWSVSTPAGGTTKFDEVIELRNVKMAYSGNDNFYMLEAAIPLKQLGIRPLPGLLLKMDWGVISTDGYKTTGRNYWADRTAVGVTDEPTEARLAPDLWGTIRFMDGTARPGPKLPDNLDPLTPGKSKDSVKDFLEEILGK
ncbi:MAG: hypothetical protein IH991_03070 [Planctomycetes bacterium]|nr:hypothetical protein [Planctomycetota bacterium]